MSLLQTLLGSPRRSLHPSNSTQNWQDRVGDLALVAGLGAATACCFSLLLRWWQILLVWVVCLLPALVLNRMGWLKIFGPVLYYDMVRQARRSRFAVLRLLYLLVLVVLLLNVTATVSKSSLDDVDVHQSSIIAQKYFDVFMVAQLITVVLLTPPYVAGAIAEEKDRTASVYSEQFG